MLLMAFPSSRSIDFRPSRAELMELRINSEMFRHFIHRIYTFLEANDSCERNRYLTVYKNIYTVHACSMGEMRLVYTLRIPMRMKGAIATMHAERTDGAIVIGSQTKCSPLSAAFKRHVQWENEARMNRADTPRVDRSRPRRRDIICAVRRNLCNTSTNRESETLPRHAWHQYQQARQSSRLPAARSVAGPTARRRIGPRPAIHRDVR